MSTGFYGPDGLNEDLGAVRPSKTMRAEYAYQALGCLGAARNLRMTRASWVQEAYRLYGDRGPLISGVEQDHWPADVKDRLRTNARAIGQAVEDAYTLWRKAGKRAFTLQRIAADYRVDGSRY
jgi:hypothetical protein